MAVFRVERNTGYTVMSNHHLRNKELSLKAKGLLSQMLSLPEDWDYTLAGLSYINRESIDAIRTAVWELEKAGYITRRQGRDEKGKMTAIEYTIYEQPQPPELDCPVLEKPTADNPILENPTTDNPTSENPTQLNKDISRTNLPKKEKSNTDLSITHSIPIHSLNPLPYDGDEAAEPPERKRTERNDAYRVYEEIIKDNIAYDILLQDRSLDRDRLNEIVDLMLETVCTARKKIRIAGDDYPAELVKSKFMKLNSEHIRFVLDCMQENTTKIRNIKQYLKAVLFNAPSTIDSYYTSLAVHVIIVQLPQIIGKPLVPDCQQPEEGGFASPLTAYQTQHDFKLASGLKCPCNRPQHEQLQGFIGVIVHISSQKVPQTEADALSPVPCKAVQKIPDGVVLILIRHNPDGGFNLFLTGQPVGFFQIEKQIFHVRIV